MTELAGPDLGQERLVILRAPARVVQRDLNRGPAAMPADALADIKVDIDDNITNRTCARSPTTPPWSDSARRCR